MKIAQLPAIPADCFGIALDVQSESIASFRKIETATKTQISGNVFWFRELTEEEVAQKKNKRMGKLIEVELAGKPGTKERIKALEEFYENEARKNGPPTKVGSSEERMEGDTPFEGSDERLADLLVNFISTAKIKPSEKEIRSSFKRQNRNEKE